MRGYPDHIRSTMLDSPEFPQSDPFTEDIVATRYSIEQLADACAAQTSCDRRFPDMGRAVSEAIAQLDAKPVTATDQGSLAAAEAGHPIDVVIDGAMFLRILREALAYEGGQSIPLLPATVFGVLDGRVPEATLSIASPITGRAALCVGYRPFCSGSAISHGTYYSVLCHDEVPFVERGSLASAAGGDPAFQEDFVSNPYLDVCETWDVGRADPSMHQPVTSNIPTLIFVGEFDPFDSVPQVRAGAVTLSNASVVEVPGQTYNNPRGFIECPLTIRNAWIDALTSPLETSCLRKIPKIEFVTKAA